MTERNQLTANIRDNLGTAHARRSRRLGGTVPAVVYGGGRPQVFILLEAHHVNKALTMASFHTQMIDLIIAGVKEPVVLKAVQYHTTKPEALHLDFLRVNADTELTVGVQGAADAASEAGGPLDSVD